jgi:hypothetical protein
MIPFSYAVLDHDGEIIRKHRWSIKEAKWFKDNNPNVTLNHFASLIDHLCFLIISPS